MYFIVWYGILWYGIWYGRENENDFFNFLSLQLFSTIKIRMFVNFHQAMPDLHFKICQTIMWL